MYDSSEENINQVARAEDPSGEIGWLTDLEAPIYDANKSPTSSHATNRVDTKRLRESGKIILGIVESGTSLAERIRGKDTAYMEETVFCDRRNPVRKI